MNLSCPVCASNSASIFLQRPAFPVHQNLICRSAGEARDIARGDVELSNCHSCGFVWNAAFDLGKLSYNEHYDNTQTCSNFFNRYVGELVRTLVEEKGVHDCNIVEVGCGKGLFLRALVEPEDWNNRGWGFDPTYEGELSDLGGRLNFERSYYGEEQAALPADVVVCRHVIEHVPDPLTLLRSIHGALQGSKHARVWFETPCVEWILKHQVVWDFFYEHCSYFTRHSLALAFEKAGFQVQNVTHVFGGQYLWIEATLSGEETIVPGTTWSEPTGERIDELARAFAAHESELRENLRQRIAALGANGKLALWGAGAKGVALANLIDPDCELFAGVVDLNPNKQTHFLPGTGHPIVDYRQLPALGVTHALVSNPNYTDENQQLLQEAGIAVELIDLMHTV